MFWVLYSTFARWSSLCICVWQVSCNSLYIVVIIILYIHSTSRFYLVETSKEAKKISFIFCSGCSLIVVCDCETWRRFHKERRSNKKKKSFFGGVYLWCYRELHSISVSTILNKYVYKFCVFISSLNYLRAIFYCYSLCQFVAFWIWVKRKRREKKLANATAVDVVTQNGFVIYCDLWVLRFCAVVISIL